MAAVKRDEDKVILQLALRTGYRIDDLLSSKLWDWHYLEKNVRIREHKTGKERSAPIDDETLELCSALMDIRRARGASTEWLIPSRRRRCNGHLSRATIWRAWTAAVRAAGYAGMGYTVHSLRKCYAVRLYHRSHNMAAVQAALNHDRITTTLLYLQDYFEDQARNEG